MWFGPCLGISCASLYQGLNLHVSRHIQGGSALGLLGVLQAAVRRFQPEIMQWFVSKAQEHEMQTHHLS